MFPNDSDTLIKIQNAYDKKAYKLSEIFGKQVQIRQSYYSPDPTIILFTVYFFSTLFAIILRCIPFYHPEFIYPERERRILQIKQFFRAVVYTYVFAMYAIGAYKLFNVLTFDCSAYY
uniref:Uncharacterized protein n=1 Tax=Panagrolaimus davidi TaxID=227884 RepID=A0A914PIJ6_9BILA